MRSIFIDAYIRAAIRSDLGVSGQSLRMMSDHVDRVLSLQSERFTDPETFEGAMSGLLRYVDRMIKSANKRGSDTLGEGDFFAAKNECGIVWWCE